jgi:hypothetical protein
LSFSSLFHGWKSLFKKFIMTIRFKQKAIAKHMFVMYNKNKHMFGDK